MSYNSPINFSSSENYPSCTSTCNIEFKYSDSTSVVFKATMFEQQCIIATYDTNQSTTVTYNGISYNPAGCLISNKSFHTHDGQKSAGEIIIYHQGTGGTGAGKILLICIPIDVGDPSTSPGGETVDKIIKTLTPSQVQLSKDTSERVSLNGMYNLTTIIPTNAPYYTYIGNEFYSAKSGATNYIVFTMDSALKVSQTAMNNLNKMVKPVNPPTQSMPVNSPSKNMIGANSKSSNELYIECKPTGSDGVLLYKKSLTGENATDDALSSPSSDMFNLNNKAVLGAIVFICALLFTGLIIFIVKVLLNKSGSSNNSTSSNSGASSSGPSS